jgi:hypothetical protein
MIPTNCGVSAALSPGIFSAEAFVGEAAPFRGGMFSPVRLEVPGVGVLITDFTQQVKDSSQ